jgi:aminoglycoside phosphotransferase (APT) family kinase protein
MTEPWEPDRELTIEIAQSVIRSSLPLLAADNLTFLGAGWEFDAYLTSDGWVVRFPRRQGMAVLFEKDRRIHPLVAQYLPPSVRVPRIELLGQPAAGFPYQIAAHRFVPGVPVDELDERALRALVPQLGAALTAIHSVSPELARESGVREAVEDDLGARDWLRSGLALLSKLPNPDPIVQGAMRWVEQASIPDVAFAGPLRFIHQDLSPEHVLANPETGQLTGIIDWTDVMLGDPARDFVFLVAWRGWSFTEEVLRHYSPGPDPGFRDRLRFMARLLTPIWLGLAHERSTEVEKVRAWVHNAYEERGGRKLDAGRHQE